jgi:hypothetical protein
MVADNPQSQTQNERLARIVLFICFLTSLPLAHLISLSFSNNELYRIGNRAFTVRHYWTLWTMPGVTFTLFPLVWIIRYLLTSNRATAPREMVGGAVFSAGLGATFFLTGGLVLFTWRAIPTSVFNYFGYATCSFVVNVLGLIFAPVAYYVLFHKWIAVFFEERANIPEDQIEFLDWHTHRIVMARKLFTSRHFWRTGTSADCRGRKLEPRSFRPKFDRRWRLP